MESCGSGGGLLILAGRSSRPAGLAGRPFHIGAQGPRGPHADFLGMAENLQGLVGGVDGAKLLFVGGTSAGVEQPIPDNFKPGPPTYGAQAWRQGCGGFSTAENPVGVPPPPRGLHGSRIDFFAIARWMHATDSISASLPASRKRIPIWRQRGAAVEQRKAFLLR